MIVTEGKYELIRTDIANGSPFGYKFYRYATVLEVIGTEYQYAVAKIVYSDCKISSKSNKYIQKITYVPLEHIVQAIPATERIYVKITDKDCTEKTGRYDYLTVEEIDYTREAGLTVEAVQQ